MSVNINFATVDGDNQIDNFMLTQIEQKNVKSLPTILNGLFGQMYYDNGQTDGSFSDGIDDNNPQWFNNNAQFKTRTYIATELRNFYVDNSNVIQNLDNYDDLYSAGGNALEQYSWQFLGYFKAPYTDSFSFTTWSDDASYLWIGDNALSGYSLANVNVNNGGSHPVQIASSDTILLNSGQSYPVRIQFGQGGGGAALSVAYNSSSEEAITNWGGICYSVSGDKAFV